MEALPLKFKDIQVYLEFSHLAVEGGAIHVQETGGFGLVASSLAQCGKDTLDSRIFVYNNCRMTILCCLRV